MYFGTDSRKQHRTDSRATCCTARFGTPVCGHVTKLTCLNNDLKDPEIKVGILGLIMVGILGLFYGRNFGTIPISHSARKICGRKIQRKTEGHW